MAKLYLSDILKKTGDVAKKATEKAATAVEIGAEKAESGAKTLKDATKREADRISASVKSAAEQTKADIAEKKAEKKATAEKTAVEATDMVLIAPQNAVKIFYYLMAIDRKITADEEEKFNLIGMELDPDFEAHKETLIKECEDQMDKTTGTSDYYDAIKNGIETALSEEQVSKNGYVTPKLLLWDLLTIANSDREYGEEEHNILKVIVQKLNIAKDVFLEMESSVLTISDIEKEITWIKGTDRTYLAIEKQVKELEKRRADILLAAKVLVML